MSHALFAFALLIAQTDTSNAEWPPLKVVDVRWIDTTASACVDFSQFANGAWLAHDTIPAAYSSSGVTRDMSDRNELVVRSVLEDAAAHRSSFPPESTPRKLGTFYATCMDSTAIEAAGIAPIRPWLRAIDSITTRTRLLPEIATLQVRGVNVAFRYSPDVDTHDAAHYITWLYQGGLGLPDRDYYFATGRAYLKYHAIAAAAPWLSTPFVQEDFAFRSRFSGAKALLPRWKRCLREADGDLGEALGQAYVAKTFPPEARARARAVIDDIRAAFHDRLLHLTWMSDATRAQPLDTLARMGEKVGYPDRWRDYSRLRVSGGPFVLNVARANAFEWQRTVNRPGVPVDTTEWGITVPTVNAYYDPTKNEMVFPAGALMPQTFDASADDGANYGSLGGSWAGHELTHGFDDEGRHYDAKGNLRDWWQPSDSTHFIEQAALVERQFNEYIQVDTFHVNGKLTEGENIADWGGLLTAYDALENRLARSGRPALIEGYTPEQRYFIAYAQSWRVHDRPEQLRTRVTVDPHAPEQWRVNGPLSNIPAFAQAFGCKAGDPMVRPTDKVPSIW